MPAQPYNERGNGSGGRLRSGMGTHAITLPGHPCFARRNGRRSSRTSAPHRGSARDVRTSHCARRQASTPIRRYCAKDPRASRTDRAVDRCAGGAVRAGKTSVAAGLASGGRVSCRNISMSRGEASRVGFHALAAATGFVACAGSLELERHSAVCLSRLGSIVDRSVFTLIAYKTGFAEISAPHVLAESAASVRSCFMISVKAQERCE
jgi:hypothetical protein